MNTGTSYTNEDLRSRKLYHGTRVDLKPGGLIEPGDLPGPGDQDRKTTCVHMTPSLDAAIRAAERLAMIQLLIQEGEDR